MPRYTGLLIILLGIPVVAERVGQRRASDVGDGDKVVFFLRHGESGFNAANKVAGLRPVHIDSPLTAAGAQQALAVRAEVEHVLQQAEAGKEILPELNDLLQADCIFVSPLTRAVQTGLLALGPLLKRNPDLKFTLVPDLREAIDAVHWDSVGLETGEAIFKRAITKLGEVLETSDPDALKSTTELEWQIDHSQVTTLWSSRAESEHALVARLVNVVKHQLDSCDRTVLVGHSAAFRALFKHLWVDYRCLDCIKSAEHEGGTKWCHKPGDATFEATCQERGSGISCGKSVEKAVKWKDCPAPAASYIPAWFRGTAESWESLLATGNQQAQPTEHLTHKKLMNLGLARASLALWEESEHVKGDPLLNNMRLLFDTRIQGVTDIPCSENRGWTLAANGQASKDGQICACRFLFACRRGRTLDAGVCDDEASNTFEPAACTECQCVETRECQCVETRE